MAKCLSLLFHPVATQYIWTSSHECLDFGLLLVLPSMVLDKQQKVCWSCLRTMDRYGTVKCISASQNLSTSLWGVVTRMWRAFHNIPGTIKVGNCSCRRRESLKTWCSFKNCCWCNHIPGLWNFCLISNPKRLFFIITQRFWVWVHWNCGEP